jgi:hypothetical protein
MSEASFASLGPTLLARKGGAKPAMRPQLAPLPGVVPPEAIDDQLEDLGWNDMGQEDEPGAQESAMVVSITPNVGREAANEDEAAEAEAAEPVTPVKTKPAKRRKSPAATARADRAKAHRAAFTLRLDTDRHLKLRLAATMQGVSAQALVTEALDAMLSEIDDLDALAERMNSHKKSN